MNIDQRAIDTPSPASFSERISQVNAVATFLILAFALCWLACLPLWLGPGLSDPALVALCGGIAMFTPALAAIIVVRVVEQHPWRRPRLRRTPAGEGQATARSDVFSSLGLRARGGFGRFAVAIAVGVLSPVVLLVASQLLAAAVGNFDLDVTLRQVVIDLDLPADTSLGEVWLAFGGRMLLAMLFGGTITMLLALGEEIGWRGYLMPRIHRLWGLRTAVIAGGVIWGLWHAPLILLGYNYPDAAPWLGQLSMIVACTTVGGFFYLLTVSFGSIWPAAVAHGVNNGVSGLLMTSLLVPGMSIDTVNGSALGWPGWIVYGVVVILGFTLLDKRRRG